MLKGEDVGCCPAKRDNILTCSSCNIRSGREKLFTVGFVTTPPPIAIPFGALTVSEACVCPDIIVRVASVDFLSGGGSVSGGVTELPDLVDNSYGDGTEVATRYLGDRNIG